MLNFPKRTGLLASLLFIGLLALFAHGCRPYREFHRMPASPDAISWSLIRPAYRPELQTVFIVADNRGTEIFDLMAPFAILSATHRLNVYVVAAKPAPILLRKGLFILPHYTFGQLDSLPHIQPRLVVVPALSDSVGPTVQWLRNRITDQTLCLSVCEGARVVAQSGLFAGRTITTHAYNLTDNERAFPQMRWVRGRSVTQDGPFFSTSGVSGAVEGALLLVQTLLGDSAQREVMRQIRYPFSQLRLTHQNQMVEGRDKWQIARKVLFQRSQRIGVLLRDSVNELDVAALLDTYHRSFPLAIQSFTLGAPSVQSQHGLVLLPTAAFNRDTPDELHILQADGFSVGAKRQLGDRGLSAAQLISYRATDTDYLFDRLLSQLSTQYGTDYARVVALLLDYNQPTRP